MDDQSVMLDNISHTSVVAQKFAITTGLAGSNVFRSCVTRIFSPSGRLWSWIFVNHLSLRSTAKPDKISI